MSHIPRAIAIGMMKAYRVVLSPILGPSCRFTPSCSLYAITSLERYGLAKGGWLALRRIGRCHPWNPGGHDPVP